MKGMNDVQRAKLMAGAVAAVLVATTSMLVMLPLRPGGGIWGFLAYFCYMAIGSFVGAARAEAEDRDHQLERQENSELEVISPHYTSTLIIGVCLWFPLLLDVLIYNYVLQKRFTPREKVRHLRRVV